MLCKEVSKELFKEGGYIMSSEQLAVSHERLMLSAEEYRNIHRNIRLDKWTEKF